MTSVHVSAPGKLMMMGEHAVVYGSPCLVTAVDHRMYATVTSIDEQVLQIDAQGVGVQGYQMPLDTLGQSDIPKGVRFIEHSVKNFYEQYGIKGGVHVKTQSDFSSQHGFGSSSASTVCVVKGLSALLDKNIDNKNIFDISFKTVIDVQGKGSGFDVAAATYGGTIEYARGGEVLHPITLSHLPLVLGYTGFKADTVTLINEVKEKAEKYPTIIDSVYREISQLVESGKQALNNEDFATFGELMDFNQGYLEALGVSSQKLAAMIHGAREAGAYGAKLSGAGKGDCMIAVVSDNNRAAVIKGIEQAGGEYIDVTINAPGVRIEKSLPQVL